MENYIPRINVHILTGDRKGFKVYSTLVEEREYALACIYKKGVNNEGREGFLVFEELENLEGEVFYLVVIPPQLAVGSKTKTINHQYL